MAKKNFGNKIGGLAFLVGFLLAIVMGLFVQTVNQYTVIALLVIGIIVGLLNIADTETKSFMTSGLVLILASAFGQTTLAYVPVLSNILIMLLTIFVPATIVVALRNAFMLSKD